MPRQKDERQDNRALLESRLRYHLRCLREDATDPDLSSLERLALVWDRARCIRDIRRNLAAFQEGSAAELSPNCPMNGNKQCTGSMH